MIEIVSLLILVGVVLVLWTPSFLRRQKDRRRGGLLRSELPPNYGDAAPFDDQLRKERLRRVDRG